MGQSSTHENVVKVLEIVNLLVSAWMRPRYSALPEGAAVPKPVPIGPTLHKRVLEPPEVNG